MKIQWHGDLTDDCHAQVGDLFAHCEEMLSGNWHVHVCRVDEEGYHAYEDLFHTADYAGTITTGEMARGIAEAIVHAAIAPGGIRKPKPSVHPCSERMKKMRGK